MQQGRGVKGTGHVSGNVAVSPTFKRENQMKIGGQWDTRVPRMSLAPPPSSYGYQHYQYEPSQRYHREFNAQRRNELDRMKVLDDKSQ